VVEEKEEKPSEESKEKPTVTEENWMLSYQKMIRTPGDGSLRIGTSLELREDIYCIAFLAQL
jgi:hypothetical protein